MYIERWLGNVHIVYPSLYDVVFPDFNRACRSRNIWTLKYGQDFFALVALAILEPAQLYLIHQTWKTNICFWRHMDKFFLTFFSDYDI